MKVIDMHCDTISEMWNDIKEGKPISLLKKQIADRFGKNENE